MKTIANTQKDIARRKGGIASAPGGSGAIDAQDSSDVDGKARAFAGFQRQNEEWKQRRGAVMEQEILLKDLLHEKQLRDKDLDSFSRIKRRVLTF
jgi:hypothetical protein